MVPILNKNAYLLCFAASLLMIFVSIGLGGRSQSSDLKSIAESYLANIREQAGFASEDCANLLVILKRDAASSDANSSFISDLESAKKALDEARIPPASPDSLREAFAGFSAIIERFEKDFNSGAVTLVYDTDNNLVTRTLANLKSYLNIARTVGNQYDESAEAYNDSLSIFTFGYGRLSFYN